MRTVLIASEKLEVYRKIHAALNSGCFIDKTTELNEVLKALGEKRYDLIFIDLEILSPSIHRGDYTNVMQRFKQLSYPVDIAYVPVSLEPETAIQSMSRFDAPPVS